MDIPRNLISDSVLIQETYELAVANGGRVTASQVVDSVFQLTHADELLATSLVNDLIGHDARFRLSDGQVEIVPNNFELQPLDETEFVVLDVEAVTTPPLPPALIELGAHRVRGGQVLDEFRALINPDRPIPSFIVSLTGITDEMLRGAPDFSDIVDDWLAFIGDAVLVAHNTAFDLPLLNREIGRVFPGWRLRNSDLCTVKLARRVIPNLESHNLDALADHFAITHSQRHRASSDALVTARILIRLLENLREYQITTLAAARTFQVKSGSAPLPLEI